MNETPKKVWLADYDLRDAATWEWEGGNLYIRADIVEELREALKAVFPYVKNGGDDYLADKVRAALAKLEDI